MKLSSRRLPRSTVEQTPAVDQAEQRQRRRQRRALVYSGEFALLREIRDITEPLAVRVAAEPVPGAYWAQVKELVNATRAVVVVILDMAAEVEASRRTAHLRADERSQARRLLVDLAKADRPAVPELDRGQLVSGAWPEVLVELCRPVAGTCSDLLDRGWSRSRDPRDSASDRLVEALRGIDRAALSLGRHIDGAAVHRERFAKARGPSEFDRARAVLAQMGVES